MFFKRAPKDVPDDLFSEIVGRCSDQKIKNIHFSRRRINRKNGVPSPNFRALFPPQGHHYFGKELRDELIETHFSKDSNKFFVSWLLPLAVYFCCLVGYYFAFKESYFAASDFHVIALTALLCEFIWPFAWSGKIFFSSRALGAIFLMNALIFATAPIISDLFHNFEKWQEVRVVSERSQVEIASLSERTVSGLESDITDLEQSIIEAKVRRKAFADKASNAPANYFSARKSFYDSAEREQDLIDRLQEKKSSLQERLRTHILRRQVEERGNDEKALERFLMTILSLFVRINLIIVSGWSMISLKRHNFTSNANAR